MNDTFDLREFIISLLRKWRFMLFLGLIFAIVAGCYQIRFGLKKIDDTSFENEIRLYEEENKSYLYQKQKIESQIEKFIMFDDTIKDSYFMGINTDHVAISEILIYVKEKQMQGAQQDGIYRTIDDAIISTYVQLVNTTVRYQIINKLGLTISLKDFDNLVCVEQDYNSQLIKIRVAHNDMTTAEQTAYAILDVFKENSRMITENIGAHELIVLMEDTELGYAEWVEESQNKTIGEIGQNQISLDRLTLQLNSLKPPQYPSKETPSVTSVIVYTAVGGLAGCGLALLLLLFKDVMNVYLRKGRDLEHYSLDVWDFSQNRKTKRIQWFKFVDQWIDNLDGVKNIDRSEQDKISKVAAILEVIVPSGETVLLTGCADSDTIDYLANCLRTELDSQKLRILTGSNILTDAKTIRQVKQVRYIVLVECCGQTTLAQIEDELNLLKKATKTVLGFMVV